MRDCHCRSSWFGSGTRFFGTSTAAPVDLELQKARGPVRIVQQPGPVNGFTLVIEFNDNGLSGPAWYEVSLVPSGATAGRSWAAAISGAGLPGKASLTLPAEGRATTIFWLYRMESGVRVSVRIVAGTACDATAATITRLPGYTTTSGGTWRERWVFDGSRLQRLRTAARRGTPLWFEVRSGRHRTCSELTLLE